MSRNTKEMIWILVGLFALLIGLGSLMQMRGYHLVYSAINGQYIWVDDEGKP